MRCLAGYPPPLAEAPCNLRLDRVCLCVILSLCSPKITARAVSSFHSLCCILCSSSCSPSPSLSFSLIGRGVFVYVENRSPPPSPRLVLYTGSTHLIYNRTP